MLVAEDDTSLGETLAKGLRDRGGYVVDLVPDGETALSYLRFYEYSVAVLGWLMPKLSGIDVVHEMRRSGTHTPVLIISALDTPADRVAGLDAGADDFMVKPFDFAELLARLRALQRRPPAVQPPRLRVGDLECDPASREVFVAGTLVPLTSTEVGILEILLRRSPAVAPRGMIAQHAWESDHRPFGSNTIDVHLRRIRSKLTDSSATIETVRGVGYRIVG
jgi:DNA-binding response OmpR family regulator